MNIFSTTITATVLPILGGTLFLGLLAIGSQALAVAATIAAVSTIIFYK